MKMDANPLLLAQVAELTERVQNLEKKQIAMQKAFDALLFTLNTNHIAPEFIEALHETVITMEDEYQYRLGSARTEWEWQALGLAVIFLKEHFAREFSDF